MVKQRMTALDVRASVEEMRNKLTGLRLLNLYDLNAKMFLLRFGHGDNKKAVLLENGVRLHLTEFVREKPKVPSQFTLKLRKHIRSWRLDSIVQLQNDRTIDLCFGAAGTASCFHIIIELFSKGNIVLTDHEYTIMMLLRTHKDNDVKIAVREKYPVEAAVRTSVVLHEWAVDERTKEMCQVASQIRDPAALEEEIRRRTKVLLEEWNSTLERNGLDETIKSTLSGVRHFGPAVAEHILTRCGLHAHTKKKDLTQTSEEIFSILLPEMIIAWDIPNVALPQGGYLLKTSGSKRAKKQKCGDPSVETPSVASNPSDPAPVVSEGRLESRQATVIPTTVQYDDFTPLLLAQFLDEAITERKFMGSFGDVCDAFFLPTEAEKIEQHNDKKKNTALSKREKFEQDHQRRIDALELQQERNVKIGELIITNADRIDEAMALVNGALATGIQWNELKSLVKRRHDEGHPVAYIIHELLLERNAISVLLEQELYDDEDDQDVEAMVVEVSLSKSANANAADYFAKKKASKAKLEKTLAATEKAAAGAARKGERQAAKQKTKKQLVVERKRGWWEKFNWFRTSGGDVAFQGKDYQTTEILIRRIMRCGDLVVHCDLAGSLPCLLRPMSSVWNTNHTGVVHHVSLAEVGGWCVSRSAAWQSKQTTSAWWIYGSQITGGTAAGSYLYNGERHYISPQPLSLGVSLLFAVRRDVGEEQSDIGVELTAFAQDGVQGSHGNYLTEGETTDVPPDSAAALHSLPTVEELRAQQRKDISSLHNNTVRVPAKCPNKQGQCTAPPVQHTDPSSTVEDKRKQVLQGNLTKQQSRKLQKIRRKYGEQDDEDRLHGAMLNGNKGSLVQELLSDSRSDQRRSGTAISLHEKEGSLSRQEPNQQEPPPSVEASYKNTDSTTTFLPGRRTSTEPPEAVAANMNEELENALRHYTSRPLPSDVVYHAVPICAPYTLLHHYPLRVELIVGSTKKGEAAATIISQFSQQLKKELALPQGVLLDLIQKMDSNDIVEQLRSDIKLRYTS